MCGIAGIYTKNIADIDSKMNAALAAMKLRGPNDQGYERYSLTSGLLTLGHTRLSIIDLSSAGHQPMHSRDRRFSIVFNGEIYNYKELRTELIAQGYVFNSDSDTEVLLNAWIAWGKACLTKLVGMFAFVVLDSLTETLTCVRDAFGIKPFFYTQENGGFIFASEISAIKSMKKEPVALNLQRSYDYLVYGDYDSGADSFIQDVFHLMPAHLLIVNLKTGTISEPLAWWKPDVSLRNDIGFSDAAEKLKEKFLESIQLHLRSDVPLGAALSGGVDSSAVVCAIRHLHPDLPIHTFSYIAKGSIVSEEGWVDKINQHVNAHSNKVVVTADELAQDLDAMIRAQGEPFGSTSIYAQYRVFKLAKDNGITVTLDGQGADELLAGYIGYPGRRFKSMFEQNKYWGALRFLWRWSRWPGRSLSYGMKLAVAEIVNAPIYKLLRRINGDKAVPTWLNPAALSLAGVKLTRSKQPPPYDMPGRRVVAELASSLTAKGLPALLRHGDRNSMRFSVESRVPFLTIDMANFLLSLPEEYLISTEGETKSIFRAAMRGIVPDEILDRKDKVGFETPEKSWLFSMAPKIRVWLSEDVGLDFLNQDKILKEFDEILAGEKPFSWQVWRWINFIRWYAVFFSHSTE